MSKATLKPEEVIEAACWLRTAFDVGVRELLKNHSGKLAYRNDWSKLTLAELWAAAADTMRTVNPAAAGALIQDVDSHRAVFLDEWRYDTISRLTKADLDAAWSVLRDPTAPARTRLAAFP